VVRDHWPAVERTAEKPQLPNKANSRHSLEASVPCTSSKAFVEDFAYQNQHGLLDPSEWTARLESARDLMTMPQMRRNWLANRQQYSENLQRVIDPLASTETD